MGNEESKSNKLISNSSSHIADYHPKGVSEIKPSSLPLHIKSAGALTPTSNGSHSQHSRLTPSSLSFSNNSINSGHASFSLNDNDHYEDEDDDEDEDEGGGGDHLQVNALNNEINSNEKENIANGSSNSNSNNNSPVVSTTNYTNITLSTSSSLSNDSSIDGNLILKTLKLIDKNRFLSSIKCSILGVTGSGKTSFMRRFSLGEFKRDEVTTLGGTRSSHTIHYSGISLNMEIWDLGGHDRLQLFLPYYIQGSNCILVMFDVTSSVSFRKAFSLLSKAKNALPNGTMFLLVANKVDLPSNLREVTIEEISKACQDSEIPNVSWCEISAKTGYNIHEPFQIIARNIMNMINVLKSNQRLEKLNQSLSSTSSERSPGLIGVSRENLKSSYNTITSNIQLVQAANAAQSNSIMNNIPSFCEFDDSNEEVVESNDNVFSSLSQVPDIAMLRNNIYTCIERSFKPLPQPVILKLDISKIVIEPTSFNSTFLKFISKRNIYFNDSSNENNLNNGNSSNNTLSNNSYCIIVDKLHPKRIEFKKRLNSSPNSDIILLCDYREHLIKSFLSLSPNTILITEGFKSSDKSDFIFTFMEYLKYFNQIKDSLNPSGQSGTSGSNSNSSNNVYEQKLESSILKSGSGLSFNSLEFSGLLKQDTLIQSLSNTLLWNSSITQLDLSNNSFSSVCSDLKIFGELLTSINNSPSILHLDLSGNHLGSKFKAPMIEFIQSMKLKSLNLSDNDLHSFANLIIQSISQNSTSLLSLRFAKNMLNSDHAQSISQMIQTNHTIQSIDLSNNQIDEKGALFLLKSLESKLSLQKLNFSLSSLLLNDSGLISEKTITRIRHLLNN